MGNFELIYLLEPLEEHPTFFTKRMFGGLAVYFQGKMVLVLMEDKNQKSYQGREYDHLIWNGVLVPTDRQFHPALMKEFSNLKPHVVLGKWLYLSMEDDHFEESSLKLIEMILRMDEAIGIFPKERKKQAPRKLRGIRNLGPQIERDLNSVGITTVRQFFDAGWEEVYCRLVLAYPKRNNLNMLTALIGAFDDQDWRHISADQKAEAQKWVEFFK